MHLGLGLGYQVKDGQRFLLDCIGQCAVIDQLLDMPQVAMFLIFGIFNHNGHLCTADPFAHIGLGAPKGFEGAQATLFEDDDAADK